MERPLRSPSLQKGPVWFECEVHSTGSYVWVLSLQLTVLFVEVVEPLKVKQKSLNCKTKAYRPRDYIILHHEQNQTYPFFKLLLLSYLIAATRKTTDKESTRQDDCVMLLSAHLIVFWHELTIKLVPQSCKEERVIATQRCGSTP